MRTVVELKLFMRLVEGRLSDSERKALIDRLSAFPNDGDLIPGAGGARKLRWAVSGRGRSGGARVILFNHCEACPTYLLFVYLKSERTNLSQSEIARFKIACKELSDAHK